MTKPDWAAMALKLPVDVDPTPDYAAYADALTDLGGAGEEDDGRPLEAGSPVPLSGRDHNGTRAPEQFLNSGRD